MTWVVQSFFLRNICAAEWKITRINEERRHLFPLDLESGKKTAGVRESDSYICNDGVKYVYLLMTGADKE